MPNAKTIHYVTEGDAIQAASVELKRKHAELTLELAKGRVGLYPKIPAIVEGYKPEIDATPWVIVSVTH